MFEDLFFSGEFDDNEDFLPVVSISDDDEVDDADADSEMSLAILALKNTVLYPGVVIPITIGRDRSIKAIKYAQKNGKVIGVVSQLDPNQEEPESSELYHIGSMARILKVLKMPDGSSTAILQGRKRIEILQYTQEEPFWIGDVSVVQDQKASNGLEFSATLASIKDIAKRIIEISPNIPSEATMMLSNIKNESHLLNFITSNLKLEHSDKQGLLEETSMAAKAEKVLQKLDKELQMLELRSQIEKKVRGDLEKQQRDYFLNQQMKTIQEELGQNPHQEDLANLQKRADKKRLPEHALKTFNKEMKRVKRMNPQMAEYGVTLSYLELLLELPWQEYTKDNFNLKSVKRTLDKDHHGLDDVKERILEHLAVLKLKGDMKAPIICLVGPPGVGKTSLGKSIAKALKRKFIRMSLGGLHDESEVRGHRKTYIGAMPGRIVQSIKKAGSGNPVFILDEIDKIGKDFRGDPSSALLEVLDPEQNATFYDNYLELEYDLSKVLFIATANSLATIQPALRDRMEIIHVSGYSLEEKVQIAKKHLIPEQRIEHGLKTEHVKLDQAVLKSITAQYTRESGVRGLNRQIARVMRNIAKKVAMEDSYTPQIKTDDLKDILGPAKFSQERDSTLKTHGVAIGLAWTRVGGDILHIEAAVSRGKGMLKLTGNLGDVMKESANAALTYLKANHKLLKIKPELFSQVDIHIHVPEGAIPKDGPSAGITMITAIASALLRKRVKSKLAMTGEITLRGKVLPVGGIKEKVLAAKRAGIKEIMMCAENRKHVEEIQANYIKGVSFIYVDKMSDVLKHALGLG